MKTSRFRFIVPLVAMMSTLGCHVTMAELKALNPHAATLEVPCHPVQIPENVDIWATQVESGHIVTEEQKGELFSFAPLASVFIKFNKAAPGENAEIMASQYGLSCPLKRPVPPPSSDSLRNNPPCPSDVAQSNGRPNPGLLADPGKPDCNSPKQAKKVQAQVRVCARPDGVPTNVTHWASRDDKGYLLINNEKMFMDAVAKADILFLLDQNAPAESVYWFVKDSSKLRCPNKPPPEPYDRAKAGGKLEWIASAVSQAANLAESATGRGDWTTTETSSPDGKGPPLSTFETIARNMSLFAAVVNMDTSGNAKDPNGDRHGMVNGTNVGGWSFPALQAGLSALQILTAVGLSPKAFVEKIAAATKGGQRVIINEADKAAFQMADELIEKAGQYEVAKGLQEISAVLPFNLGQKFTAGLESKFQAHKIFEKQAFDHFPEIFPKKELKDAIAKAPSVILTDVEHQAITKELNKFWRDVAAKGKKYRVPQHELRKLYQEAYQDHPHWLQAIEHFLRQVP